MPRFVPYCYDQSKLIPVDFRSQIQPGTFEFTLHLMIDENIDLSVFQHRYHDDDTGRPAYDPAILLKIVLFSYSRDITSSREMFAIDGCKLPSNGSKEWSGTIKELTARRDKLEKAVQRMLAKHQATDSEPQSDVQREQEKKQINTLRNVIDKREHFLNHHDDKLGATGKPIETNLTDNESARIKTAKGVIQGYCGIASVDSSHQIILAADAHGKAQEHQRLLPTL